MTFSDFTSHGKQNKNDKKIFGQGNMSLSSSHQALSSISLVSRNPSLFYNKKREWLDLSVFGKAVYVIATPIQLLEFAVFLDIDSCTPRSSLLGCATWWRREAQYESGWGLVKLLSFSFIYFRIDLPAWSSDEKQPVREKPQVSKELFSCRGSG